MIVHKHAIGWRAPRTPTHDRRLAKDTRLKHTPKNPYLVMPIVARHHAFSYEISRH